MSAITALQAPGSKSARRSSSRLADSKIGRAVNVVVEQLEGRVLLSGNLPASIHASTDAAYTLSGDPTNGYSLVLSAGTYAFDANVGAAGGDLPNLTLTLTNSAVAAFNSPQTLTGLSLSGTAKLTATSSGGGSAGNVLAVGTGGFSMPLDPTTHLPTATLDLMDNDMLLQGAGSAELPVLQALLLNGLPAGGTGLGSSDAAASPTTNKTALGYGLNGSTVNFSTFDGQPVVAGDVLVKYTLAGDANLDGSVGNIDYGILRSHLNRPGTTWTTGDFNYDTQTDSADYGLLSNNFGLDLTGPNYARTIQPVGLPVSAVEGQPFTGALATFADALNTTSNPTSPGEYQASVDWGDGTFVAATVTADTDPADPSGFVVTGTSPSPLSNPDALIVTKVQYSSASGLQGRPASLGEPVVSLTPAVEGLYAVPVSVSQVNLYWTLNANNATSIEVARAVDGGSYATLAATAGGSATMFTDTTVSEGHSYSYEIRAVQPIGDSAYSDPAVATTLAVQGLYATAASTTEIDLSWLNLSSDPAATVDVQRAPFGSSTFTTIAAGLPAGTSGYSDMTGLSEGTHWTYQVLLHEPGMGNLATLSDPADTWTLPAAPTGLTVTSTASGEVDLSWANGSASSPGFLIERSTDNLTFDPVDQVAAGTTSYADASPFDGVSYYRVDATNDGGQSGPSDVVQATTPLAAPSELSATAVSDDEIDIAWVNNSQAADGLRIERSQGDDMHFAPLPAITDPTASTFDDSGLTAGTLYYYRVEATNSASNLISPASGEASDTTIPLPPASFAATVASPNQLNLTWASAPGATGYLVERMASGGAWAQLATPDSTATSYDDSGLWDGVQYSYRISAYNAAGTSAPSDTATATTPQSVPAAPSSLQAIALSSSSVQLVWTNNAYNEQGFKIQASPDGVNEWTVLGQTAPGTTTFTVTGLQGGTGQYYQVLAFNSAGASAAAPAAGVLASTPAAPAAPQAPSAPTGLTATAAGENLIWLTWNVPAQGSVPATYSVQRSDGGPFAQIATVAPAAGACDGGTVRYGTTYTYRLVALAPDALGNPILQSAPSNTASAALSQLVPTTPGNVSAYPWLHGDKVTISWEGLAVGETEAAWRPDGFHIYLVDEQANPTALLATVGADVSCATVSAAAGFSRYVVKAYNSAGESADGGVGADVVDSPAPTAPVLGDAVVDGAGHVTLSWTGLPMSAQTVIEVSPDGVNWFGSPGNYTGQSVAPGFHGYFRMSGLDGNSNWTAYSNAVPVTGPALPAPSGFTAVAAAPTAVNLSWGTVPSNTFMEIDRSDGGGPFLPITPGSPDSTVQEGKTYAYRARFAEYGPALPGISDWAASGSVETPPNAPVYLVGEGVSATEIDATWTCGSEAAATTTVDLSADSNFSSIAASATLPVGTTTYAFTGLTPGTTYYLRARHNLADGTGSAYLTGGTTTTAAASVVSVSRLLDAAELGPDGQPQDGYFLFTRTGVLTRGLTVNYTVDTSASNAATAGHEYQALSGTVSFAAGQSNVLIPVVPNEINHVGPTTTVTAALSSSIAYTAAAGHSSATANLINTDDAAITVPQQTFDIGIATNLGIQVIGHYGRPIADTLSLTTDDASALSFKAASISCGADGVAFAQVTAAPTSAAPTVTASDVLGNAGVGQQVVASLSPWTRVGNWTTTFAKAKSGEGCTLEGLAFLVTGQQSDWSKLKVDGVTGTDVLKPGVIVDVTPLLSVYDARLRQNVIAATKAFAATRFGPVTSRNAKQSEEDYVNSFFVAGTINLCDCQNADFLCLQKALVDTLYTGEADELDILARPVGDGGYAALVKPSGYGIGDRTWINNAVGVKGDWAHENLICLDPVFANAATKYWGFTGKPKTGNFAFWQSIMQSNGGGKLPVSMSGIYGFWNVPLICQKLFGYRESRGEPS